MNYTFVDDAFDREQQHIADCDAQGRCANCGCEIPADCYAWCENCFETGGEWEPEVGE